MEASKMHDEGKLAGRAKWERPVLRRLAANKAEGKGKIVDDGQCIGVGASGHHNCS